MSRAAQDRNRGRDPRGLTNHDAGRSKYTPTVPPCRDSLARADRDLGCGLPRRPARSWTRGRPVDDHPGNERPLRTKPAGREGRRSISRLAERIRCPSGSYRARRDRPGALRLEMLYLQRPQQIRAISHRPRRRRAHVHAHKPRRVRGGRGAQATSARPRQNAQIAERGERVVSHLSFATRLSGVKRTFQRKQIA